MALVLVVDDDPHIRDLVRAVLEYDGYAVCEAQDGAVALAQMQRHCPDLVLLDLSMPVMNGWAFLEQCSGQPAYRGVPIVVMSVFAHRPGLPAIPSWVTRFLDKPFQLPDLLYTVRDVLAVD